MKGSNIPPRHSNAPIGTVILWRRSSRFVRYGIYNTCSVNNEVKEIQRTGDSDFEDQLTEMMGEEGEKEKGHQIVHREERRCYSTKEQTRRSK